MAAAALTFEGFGGVALAADAWGSPDDPTVLLLHGGGQTRRSWRQAGQALAAAGRYAVAVDLRGHGDSDWPADGRYDLTAFAKDLRAVLAQLPTRPAVVGASIGGLAALAALTDGGESLASALVLIDAAPWVDTAGSQRLAGLMRRHAEGFASLDEAAAAASELSPRRRPADPQTLRAQMRCEGGRYYWRWDPRFLTGFDMASVADLEASVGALKLPTLVMHGQASTVVTETEMARFHTLMPTAEFAEVEGAGHLVAAEQADAFNALLLEFLERRAPRAPLVFDEGSDPRTLRDALGSFATGVVVITARDAAGAPVGLTANSFTSVSLDPPLILFCVAKTAGSLAALEQSRAFAVNVLHIGQQPASALFSKPGADRFSATPWEAWDSGTPILTNSLASIDCDAHARHDGGDHVIFIGRVRHARFEPRRDPLLYFRGRYRRLHFA
ncbi:MAG: hsaB [Caulobacter sp.]|nr:hsaB [Caulobacter sp.]